MEQAFPGALFFFFSVPVGISKLPASLVSSLGYVRHQNPSLIENRLWIEVRIISRLEAGNSPQCPAWVLRSLSGLLSSLCLSESSYACFIHNVQNFRCG